MLMITIQFLQSLISNLKYTARKT